MEVDLYFIILLNFNMILELNGNTSLTPSDVAKVLEKIGEVINIGLDSYAVISGKDIKIVVQCEMVEDGLTRVRMFLDDGEILKKILNLKDLLEIEFTEVNVK